MNADFRFLLTALCLATPVQAQQSLDSAFRTTGPEVTAAFEAQRAILQASSAVIQQGRQQLSYGLVFSADGFILTKASEIEGQEGLSVLVDRRTFRDVNVVAVDSVWDVALLKVEAEDLVPVDFIEQDAAEIPLGTWVVANGATSRFARRALAGVISANARAIPAGGGAMLGVVFKTDEETLLVEQVVEGSGAEAAGLTQGDILRTINGAEVTNVEEVVEALEGKSSGELVEIVILRDEEEQTVQVALISREELFAEQMMTRNDMMSGDFSKRRSGFPRVIQHDILGNSNTVGGPLLDLEGRCIGMNIARANRAESFAIPAKEVREIAERLIAQKP